MAPRGPLVVAYHAVSASWRHPLTVPEELLGAQLAFLRRRGYVGLTAAEAEHRRKEGALPDRSVVVTFDDGFRSVLRARPILEELRYPATVFVVTAFVESQRPLRWEGIEGAVETEEELMPLGWEDLELLCGAGWEIGSHTVTHRLSTDLTDVALEHEFVESRLTLERRLGACNTIAYPYGRADTRVAAAAERAGYSAGFVLARVHRPDGPYLRPRLELTRRDRGARLALRLSPAASFLRRSRAAGALSRIRRTVGARADWLPAPPPGRA
jgi:peptidoglycan/xylan/chitin deacetylase (PgdA/CDA1 family)